MRTHIFAIIVPLLILASCTRQPQSLYDAYYSDGTLRIDYFHTGDAKTEQVELTDIYRYDSWAGSKINLIDRLDYGANYYKIYDAANEVLIYSKGFDSYFREYQVSTPAIDGIRKQFHESAIVPLPKASIIFALEKRDKSGKLNEIYRETIDPSSVKRKPIDPEVSIFTSLENGPSALKADIAIIGEGYTKDQSQKFQDDLLRFTDVFFKAEPCKSNKDKFNVRGVLKPSKDSGIDEPRAGIDKSTAVNASFNTMGSERYVLTEDNKSLRDIAGHVPYDALYIMVNHSRYGGGGIYNFYCVYTSDNSYSEYVMVHEFGHSFFGLADEYYSSSTAYTDFYPTNYEPNEPNITALKDPGNVKWNHLLSEGVAIPTPWGKESYDSLNMDWQARRSELNEAVFALQKNGASDEDIERARRYYDEQSLKNFKASQEFLENSPLAGKVGAFEGAGYASTGLYRPSINCIMFTKTDYFCPVCQDAMVKVLDAYSR